VSSLTRRPCRPNAKAENRSNRTVELLIGVGIGLVLFLAFDDAVSNAKYRSRSKACRTNLQSIGEAISLFHTAHQGEMPPSLVSLAKDLPNKYVLMCPVDGSKYVYRYRQNPTSSDVICWDAHFQRPDHSVLFWLNVPSRNVLTAGGKVETLPEQTFQALHLQH
jgi:hypothetical protein